VSDIEQNQTFYEFIAYCLLHFRSITVEMPAVKSYPYKWGAAVESLKRANAFLPSALNHLEKLSSSDPSGTL